ncbi:MAG: conjugal transfer protein TraF [Deferrisomatales bacterium]|nr:conjugal transfer protein TraF [Deferrisomatales bacterium]
MTLFSPRRPEILSKTFGLLMAALALLPSVGICGQQTDAPSYYETRQQGWFWYQDPAEQRDPVEELPHEAPAPWSLDAYSPDELWTLHPDEFRVLLDTVFKGALQQPTEEKVLEYKRLETIARLRAARFASVASLVSLKHPEVSTLRDAPSVNPGMRARRQVEGAEIDATLSAAREDFALLYFTSPGCPFCVEQDGVLRYFTAKHGWEIKRIDVDREPRAAEFFRVSTTPTLLLVQRGADATLPVGVGVVGLSALERNLFRGVRLLSGTVTEEDLWLFDYQRGGGFDPAAVLGTGVRGFPSGAPSRPADLPIR